MYLSFKHPVTFSVEGVMSLILERRDLDYEG